MSHHGYRFLILLPLAVLLAGARPGLANPLGSGSGAFPPASPVEETFDYRDDQDHRVNGSVVVRLLPNHAGGGHLELSFRADGPYVDSQRGYRGLRGQNRHTAFELGQMTGQGFQVVTFDEVGRLVTGAPAIRTSWAYLKQRGLRLDGTLAYQESMPLPSMVRVDVDGADLPPGRYRTDVRVNAESRFRIRYELGPDGATVHGMEPVGHGPFSDRRLFPEALLLTAAQVPKGLVAAHQAMVALPVSARNWRALDNEAKWVRYRKSLERSPSSQAAWIDFLFKEKDYPFLGMIALYQLDAFETLELGKRLKEAQAPNWIAITAWMVKGNRGHVTITGPGLLVHKSSQDQVYSWFKKYPEMQKEDGLQNTWKSLVNAKAKEVDISHLDPPLKVRDVLQHLDAPTEVASLGNRKKAQPSEVYDHQVERAINGMIAARQFSTARRDQLTSLVNHANTRVRLAAILAHTHLAPDQVNGKRFLDLASQQEESGPIREAALMAFSYTHDYEAYLVLNRIALDPSNPVWKPAVSRLGDMGDGFTLEQWSSLKKLSFSQRRFLNRERKRIEARVEKINADRVSKSLWMGLQRLAWAEIQGDPMAPPMKAWVHETVRPYVSSKKVQSSLNRMSKEDRIKAIPQPLRTKVAELARDLKGND